MIIRTYEQTEFCSKTRNYKVEVKFIISSVHEHSVNNAAPHRDRQYTVKYLDVFIQPVTQWEQKLLTA